MDPTIASIRNELTRRYDHIFYGVKPPSRFAGRGDFISFARVHDYLKFVLLTQVLKALLDDEQRKWQEYEKSLLSQNLGRFDRRTRLENFSAFNLWDDFGYILEWMYKPIESLRKEVDPAKMDRRGLAFTKSVWFILKLRMSWYRQIWAILNITLRTDKSFEIKARQKIKKFHSRLMSLLGEYEVLPKEARIIEPNATMRQLGISPESKWEDIELAFRTEFEVRIKYKDNEVVVNHEDMGFSDKRQPDETKAKGSWEFLRLLAMDNGVFPLSKLTGKDRENRKKQKQLLAKSLKQYFQIQSDPFYEVSKDESEYKIKMKLIPDPEFRDDWRDRHIRDGSQTPREYLMKV